MFDVSEIQQHFEKFLARYTDAWNGGDFDAVLSLWEQNIEEPWHFPEELDQPLVGWEAIKQYLQEAQAAIANFSVELSDAAIKPLSDQHYIFRFGMRWRATMKSDAGGASKPLGAHVRVSGVLKETEDGLRLVHYMEAGPAAFPFIKKMYEDMAAN